MRGGNRSIVAILFLVVLVSVALGPNTLPRLLSQAIPGFDQGVPCAWLRLGDDRAFHQSLLGRAAESPLSVSVRASTIPTKPDGFLIITVTLTNNSLGTVPIIFNPQQVIVGDNGSSGMGLIFSPANSLDLGFTRPADPASFPESNIHVLQPRQSCIYEADFPAGNVLIDPAASGGNAQVTAYYRSNGPGQVYPNPATPATPIYYDQGLSRNLYVESAPARILPASP